MGQVVWILIEAKRSSKYHVNYLIKKFTWYFDDYFASVKIQTICLTFWPPQNSPTTAVTGRLSLSTISDSPFSPSSFVITFLSDSFMIWLWFLSIWVYISVVLRSQFVVWLLVTRLYKYLPKCTSNAPVNTGALNCSWLRYPISFPCDHSTQPLLSYQLIQLLHGWSWWAWQRQSIYNLLSHQLHQQRHHVLKGH